MTPEDAKLELLLLSHRSLIATKEMMVATANRELSMGGWKSDWEAQIGGIESTLLESAQAIAAEIGRRGK